MLWNQRAILKSDGFKSRKGGQPLNLFSNGSASNSPHNAATTNPLCLLLPLVGPLRNDVCAPRQHSQIGMTQLLVRQIRDSGGTSGGTSILDLVRNNGSTCAEVMFCVILRYSTLRCCVARKGNCPTQLTMRQTYLGSAQLLS
jgi:hypothetical protein